MEDVETLVRALSDERKKLVTLDQQLAKQVANVVVAGNALNPHKGGNLALLLTGGTFELYDFPSRNTLRDNARAVEEARKTVDSLKRQLKQQGVEL